MTKSVQQSIMNKDETKSVAYLGQMVRQLDHLKSSLCASFAWVYFYKTATEKLNTGPAVIPQVSYL